MIHVREPRVIAASFVLLCVAAVVTFSSDAALRGTVTGEAHAGGMVKVVCVGDVMLDRSVWARIQANGSGSIFRSVMADLRAGDLAFANLECPLADSGPHAPKDCVFRAPTKAVGIIKTVPFDVVTLANNHTYDAGRKALDSTMAVLDKAGIKFVGARRKDADQPVPVYFDVGGVRVGFLGYTALSFAHGGDAKVKDIGVLRAQIAAAKSQADLLFVSYHWGDEYRQMPTRRQREIGHASIEAGADVVLGHHPHVLEGIEAYRGGLILYSMGNFVFDQRAGERMETAIFTVTRGETGGLSVTAKPMWIPLSTCAPRPPDATKRNAILKRLQKISVGLGTRVEVAGGIASVRSSAAKPQPAKVHGSN